MLTYYGGDLQLNLTDQCTHLITSKCKGKKYEKACKLANLKIVSPDWILDSIQQNKRNDETIYHPKYLITPEYLQMKKEREELLRLEQERQEQRKLEEDRKRIEEERKRAEDKKRIDEERKRLIDEERKKLEEERKKKEAAAASIVQNKLSNVNISSSSSLNSQNLNSSTQQQQSSISTITVPAILTQNNNTTTNSVNAHTTQLTLRTVSLPSSTLSNISVSQNTQAATINSPIKQSASKVKVLLPNHQLTRMAPNTSSVQIRPSINDQQTTSTNLQNQQQNKTRILAPHSVPMTIQQGQVQQVQNIYSDQTMINQQHQQHQQQSINSQQQQQSIQYQQINTIQKPIINNQQAQQQQQNQYQQQNANYQQQTANAQLRTGDQLNTNNAPRQVYLAVQQPQIQYRPNHVNFIQIRPQQYLPVQQQQAGVQNQQQIRGQQQQQQQQIRQIQPNQLSQLNQQHQQATIVSTSNTATKLQQTITGNANENVIGNALNNNNSVQKSTNIILQQRVQPPVQMQAQQNQQQANMQATNLQPMIIQQQANATQLTGNSQIAQQPNQAQSIQVLPGQQFIQIQRPVHGQQILRGQNQQIIFHQPANNLQQNGPRQTQIQTLPQVFFYFKISNFKF